jgi:hypothetical protein
MPTLVAARLTGSPRSTQSRSRHALCHEFVAGRLRDDAQRLDDGHACRERDRERSRDARQDAFVDERPDHGNAQLPRVPAQAAVLGGYVLACCKGSDHQPAEYRAPVVLRKRRHAHDDPRGPRNLVAERAEQRREAGNHERRQHADGYRDGAQNDERIARCRLDAIAHVLVAGQVFRQALERGIQRSGLFAHLEDADVERRKDPRMARETACQVAAAFEIREDVFERFAQRYVVSRCRQSLDASQQRDAGLRDRVHLPREQHDVRKLRRPNPSLRSAADRSPSCVCAAGLTSMGVMPLLNRRDAMLSRYRLP